MRQFCVQVTDRHTGRKHKVLIDADDADQAARLAVDDGWVVDNARDAVVSTLATGPITQTSSASFKQTRLSRRRPVLKWAAAAVILLGVLYILYIVLQLESVAKRSRAGAPGSGLDLRIPIPAFQTSMPIPTLRTVVQRYDPNRDITVYELSLSIPITSGGGSTMDLLVRTGWRGRLMPHLARRQPMESPRGDDDWEIAFERIGTPTEHFHFIVDGVVTPIEHWNRPTFVTMASAGNVLIQAQSDGTEATLSKSDLDAMRVFLSSLR